MKMMENTLMTLPMMMMATQLTMMGTNSTGKKRNGMMCNPLTMAQQLKTCLQMTKFLILKSLTESMLHTLTANVS